MDKLPKIYSFEEALIEARKNSDQKLCTKGLRLLLGNGFSQAYFGKFSYKSLFTAIQEQKENERIKKLFNHFGTSNFEAVLSFLKHTQFLSTIYGFPDKEIKSDYERLRDSLAEAIVKVHPENTNEIPKKNQQACYKFLEKFDEIFTVNYDLLLYWVLLQDPSLAFGDYFFRDENTPNEFCEYFQDGSKSEKHIFFLHGALHLFLKNGVTTKKVWGNTVPLIEQIKSEIENGYYPLVVTEGDSDSKLNQIKGNPYLNHGLSSFLLKKGQLFSFGFSFSDQDNHIIDAIVKNMGLNFLWIGIRGDIKKNSHFLEIAKKMEDGRGKILKGKEKTKSSLSVYFYDAGNVNLWGKDDFNS